MIKTKITNETALKTIDNIILNNHITSLKTLYVMKIPKMTDINVLWL